MSNNQNAYNNIVWEDDRKRPEWQELQDVILNPYENGTYLQLKWDEIKSQRDKLIDDVMWEYQRHDRETRLSQPHKRSDDWMHRLDLYVQELADIPQKYVNPDDVVWPDLPAHE